MNKRIKKKRITSHIPDNVKPFRIPGKSWTTNPPIWKRRRFTHGLMKALPGSKDFKSPDICIHSVCYRDGFRVTMVQGVIYE